jgi:hypothetical protein
MASVKSGTGTNEWLKFLRLLYTKKTRRQVFLEEMEQVVPWRTKASDAGASAPGGGPS